MVYIVQTGDTLFKIARKFGVTVEAIVAANNIKDPNVISVGQRLIIPGVTRPPAQGPTIRRGSRGPAVVVLQESLVELGYDPGPVNGFFGAQTEAAVRKFQADWRIRVDGIVGPVTWRTLALALAGAPPPPPTTAPPTTRPPTTAPPTTAPPTTAPPTTAPPTGIPGEPANLPAPEKRPVTDIIPYDLEIRMLPMGRGPATAEGFTFINTSTGEVLVEARNLPAPYTFGANYLTYHAYFEVPGRKILGRMIQEVTTTDYYTEARVSLPISERRVTIRPASLTGRAFGPPVLVGRLV